MPVHMGSPRFQVVDVDGFRITDAWFQPGQVLPPHVHEWTVFAVMLEGSFQDVFRSRSYECSPATVFTEPAGETHANRIESAGARVLIIQPDHDRTELLQPVVPLLEEVNNFRHGGIETLARRVTRELRAGDSAAPLAIEALILDMLASAVRAVAGPKDAAGPPPWLERVRELVHAGFREAPKIAEVAQEVGVHPVHLARVFRQHFNIPLGTYVRRLRLEWSAERLLEGDLPIAAIALEAGFSDQSHFTRAFKRHFGMTPGEYRLARRPDGRPAMGGQRSPTAR
ncbi:MAG: AraC family transcriptional regulator [Gemmatimonadota bacterium]